MWSYLATIDDYLTNLREVGAKRRSLDTAGAQENR